MTRMNLYLRIYSVRHGSQVSMTSFFKQSFSSLDLFGSIKSNVHIVYNWRDVPNCSSVQCFKVFASRYEARSRDLVLWLWLSLLQAWPMHFRKLCSHWTVKQREGAVVCWSFFQQLLMAENGLSSWWDQAMSLCPTDDLSVSGVDFHIFSQMLEERSKSFWKGMTLKGLARQTLDLCMEGTLWSGNMLHN